MSDSKSKSTVDDTWVVVTDATDDVNRVKRDKVDACDKLGDDRKTPSTAVTVPVAPTTTSRTTSDTTSDPGHALLDRIAYAFSIERALEAAMVDHKAWSAPTRLYMMQKRKTPCLKYNRNEKIEQWVTQRDVDRQARQARPQFGCIYPNCRYPHVCV